MFGGLDLFCLENKGGIKLCMALAGPSGFTHGLCTWEVTVVGEVLGGGVGSRT